VEVWESVTVDEAIRRPPVEDPLYRALASIGSAELEELRYQFERRGLALDEEELDRLVEQGHAVEVEGTYSIAIPERLDRGNMRGPAFKSGELLERLKLWALIVGRPPSEIQWGHPARIRGLIGRLRHRLQTHLDCLELYEQGDWPSYQTIVSRFGSMNAALVAAGFEPRGRGKQPQEELDAEMATARSNGRRRESLEEAYERVGAARSEGDEEQLHDALVATAIAAFNEAERIKPWKPDA
jgi:hypothetical protein